MLAPSLEIWPSAMPPNAPICSPVGTSIWALASHRFVAGSVLHVMNGASPPGLPRSFGSSPKDGGSHGTVDVPPAGMYEKQTLRTFSRPSQTSLACSRRPL